MNFSINALGVFKYVEYIVYSFNCDSLTGKMVKGLNDSAIRALTKCAL
jgi:hypothetical protein